MKFHLAFQFPDSWSTVKFNCLVEESYKLKLKLQFIIDRNKMDLENRYKRWNYFSLSVGPNLTTKEHREVYALTFGLYIQGRAIMSYCQENVFKWRKFLEKFHCVRKKTAFFYSWLVPERLSNTSRWQGPTTLSDQVAEVWLLRARGRRACSSIPLCSSRGRPAWLFFHFCSFYFLLVFCLYHKVNC